jgi:excisionase family DNA binding protein
MRRDRAPTNDSGKEGRLSVEGVLFNVKAGAKRLGISASKLYQMASRRKIPHYRIGGKILFSDEQIQEFLNSCKVQPAGPAKAKPPPVRLQNIKL